MFSLSKLVRAYIRTQRLQRLGLEGLHLQDVVNFPLRSGPRWLLHDSDHIQIISPGRSGTRWLGNVFLESSNALVVHSSNPTLAEPGYLLHKKVILESEALGAYRQSRADFIKVSNQLNRRLFDLDCKNSPLAHILAKEYPKMLFLVCIRDPISFIKSGIIRGYFNDKDPQEWGHIYEQEDCNFSKNPEEWQIYKIAEFWRLIARISVQMLETYTERVIVLNSRKMFDDFSVLNQLFSDLKLHHTPLNLADSFGRVSNANRKLKKLSYFQESLLNSSFLLNYCMEDISHDFIMKCGWRKGD